MEKKKIIFMLCCVIIWHKSSIFKSFRKADDATINWANFYHYELCQATKSEFLGALLYICNFVKWHTCLYSDEECSVWHKIASIYALCNKTWLGGIRILQLLFPQNWPPLWTAVLEVFTLPTHFLITQWGKIA